ncbi:restriction endonuclease subunit S [Limnospira platensis]|uniref:restriction endonuclease subunit S n=1 Tax=Limnospira platensis TaxID=118562 RepID=UPI003D6EC369
MSEWKETEIGLIPSDWHIDKLENHVQPQRGITYGIVKVGDFVPGGVPVIRGGDIRDGSIVFDDQKRVAEEVSNQFRRTILQGGEILLNLIAEPGHAAIVPDELMSSNVSRDVAVIPLDDSVDHKFVCYFLRSEASITWLTNRLQGTVTQKINLGVLRELPILLMSLDEQRRIAHFLDCLDRSISNLRRQNETLERIAQTLFKHWFVDFEFPNADGKPYKSSGGEMRSSELGEIPVGWRVQELGKISEVGTGKGLKRHEFQEDGIYPVLGANGEMGRTNKFLKEEKLILTGRVGTLGVISLSNGKVWISDNVIMILPTIKSFYFVYFCLRKTNLKLLNRGSTQPLITQGDVKKIVFAMPGDELLLSFERLCLPIFHKVEHNIRQIQTLTQTRDTLLPKLMSGKLRITP